MAETLYTQHYVSLRRWFTDAEYLLHYSLRKEHWRLTYNQFQEAK
jgi:hypothetical protein